MNKIVADSLNLVRKSRTGEKRTHGEEVIAEAFTLVLAVALTATGIYFFKFPNHISTGGVSGLAIVIPKFLPVSPSMVTAVLNLALLLIGFMVFGRSFGLKTAAASILLSAFLFLFERLFPMSGPLTDEPMLELIVAILLPGFGAALLFDMKASTGGTDVIAMILKKFTHRDIGKSLFITDTIIATSIFYVYGIKSGLLSTIGLLFKAMVVNAAIDSFHRVKYFTIITRHKEEIDDYITKKLKRGSTFFQATGGFTGEEKTVIMCVVNSYQAVSLDRYIKKVDPRAFVMITNTSHIIGNGFKGKE
ncbi:hypothetical protein ABB02_01721 [Clostridiaceae bacterium JG1575]|nr:hypothetical protein ABB02_01721 [Clostridiaceae bacterium JG1575]